MNRRVMATVAAGLLSLSLGACASEERTGERTRGGADNGPPAGTNDSTPEVGNQGAVPGGRTQSDGGSDTGEGRGDAP